MGAKFSPIDCKVVFCVCRHLQNIGSNFFSLSWNIFFALKIFLTQNFNLVFFALASLIPRNCILPELWRRKRKSWNVEIFFFNIYVLWSSLSFSINIFLKLWHIPWTSLYFLGTAYMQYNWRAIHLYRVHTVFKFHVITSQFRLYRGASKPYSLADI